jgi:hypothetical protein
MGEEIKPCEVPEKFSCDSGEFRKWFELFNLWKNQVDQRLWEIERQLEKLLGS